MRTFTICDAAGKALYSGSVSNDADAPTQQLQPGQKLVLDIDADCAKQGIDFTGPKPKAVLIAQIPMQDFPAVADAPADANGLDAAAPAPLTAN